MTYSYNKQTKALNKTKSTKQMKNKNEFNSSMYIVVHSLEHELQVHVYLHVCSNLHGLCRFLSFKNALLHNTLFLNKNKNSATYVEYIVQSDHSNKHLQFYRILISYQLYTTCITELRILK